MVSPGEEWEDTTCQCQAGADGMASAPRPEMKRTPIVDAINELPLRAHAGVLTAGPLGPRSTNLGARPQGLNTNRWRCHHPQGLAPGLLRWRPTCRRWVG
jgi:hypothetical protein